MRYLLLVLMAVVLFACAHLTSQDKAELATREGEEMACIAAHSGDGPAIDACRAAVKAKWDAAWNQRFDGGFGKGGDQ